MAASLKARLVLSTEMPMLSRSSSAGSSESMFLIISILCEDSQRGISVCL
jgi:hypothetical protein